jgi:hypothetical protein
MAILDSYNQRRRYKGIGVKGERGAGFVHDIRKPTAKEEKRPAANTSN